MPQSNETSLATYQNLDGTNSTMLLRSFKENVSKNLTLTGGFGISTNFKGTNPFILEGKATFDVNKNFNVQMRSRNSFASGNSSTQLRLSTSYKTNVSDNTSIYVTPYVTEKYKFNNKEFSTDAGLFAGATHKISPDLSVSGELQKYNGLDFSAKNWGVNVILSHTF